MTTLTVSTDGASIIRPTYGRFPISSSSSGPTESIPNIDIDLGIGKYIFNSTGGTTEDNRVTPPVSIPAAGLYENPNTITESWPSSGYTAPSLSFYDRIKIQVSAENTITHAPKHFRKTIECIDNTVPFNLSELRKLDGTQRQYQIARAISSDGGAGGGGGGGGTAEIQTWY